MTEKESTARFKALEPLVGGRLACFYLCLLTDTPYIESAYTQETDKGRDRWTDFRQKRYAAMQSIEKETGRRPKKFLDGVIDVTEVMADADPESENRGTAQQRLEWGTGNPDNPYSTEDYRKLDNVFQKYSMRLVKGGGYDELQEFILRQCASLTLEMDRAIAAGDAATAQKYSKMIQDNLASENLRKKDEKPIENLRIDSVVDALEKAGMVKEGKILSYPELVKVLANYSTRRSKRFPYTLDAADQMLLAIINTMRQNDGQSELTELPDGTSLDVNVSEEFAELPNRDERTTYKELGLLRKKGG